jgi:hypothetical protein
MHCCWYTLVTIFLWQLVPAVCATSGTEVLIPISDDNWNTASQAKARRRTSDPFTVTLQDTEHFAWGPGEGM